MKRASIIWKKKDHPGKHFSRKSTQISHENSFILGTLSKDEIYDKFSGYASLFCFVYFIMFMMAHDYKNHVPS